VFVEGRGLDEQQHEEQQPLREVTFEGDDDPDRMVTYLKRERVKKNAASLTPKHIDTSKHCQDEGATGLVCPIEDRNADYISIAPNMVVGTLASGQKDGKHSEILTEMGSQVAGDEIREEARVDVEDDLLSLSLATSADFSYRDDDPLNSPRQQRQRGLQQQQQQQHGENPDQYDTEEDDVEEEVTLLYGKGLEERTKLAREPLRVCRMCYEQLQYVQEELRLCNSNAMRYNSIDPTDARRLLNSPLAFTLGHEVRKVRFLSYSM